VSTGFIGVQIAGGRQGNAKRPEKLRVESWGTPGRVIKAKSRGKVKTARNDDKSVRADKFKLIDKAQKGKTAAARYFGRAVFKKKPLRKKKIAFHPSGGGR